MSFEVVLPYMPDGLLQISWIPRELDSLSQYAGTSLVLSVTPLRCSVIPVQDSNPSPYSRKPSPRRLQAFRCGLGYTRIVRELTHPAP